MIDRNYIIGVAAIIISILYPTIIGWNNYRSARRVEKDKLLHLLDKFKFAKEFTTTVKNKLIAYSHSNNSFEIEFMQGLTFRQCISLLEEAEVKLLNDEVYDNLISLKKMPINYEDIKIGIESHIQHLSEVNTVVKLYLLQE